MKRKGREVVKAGCRYAWNRVLLPIISILQNSHDIGKVRVDPNECHIVTFITVSTVITSRDICISALKCGGMREREGRLDHSPSSQRKGRGHHPKGTKSFPEPRFTTTPSHDHRSIAPLSTARDATNTCPTLYCCPQPPHFSFCHSVYLSVHHRW